MKVSPRLLIRKGNDFLAIPLENIVLFVKKDNCLFFYDQHCNEYEYKCSVSQLMNKLDPSRFFQANRQQVINIEYVKGFRIFERVKLQVQLTVKVDATVIISQETAPLFKKWLTGCAEPY